MSLGGDCRPANSPLTPSRPAAVRRSPLHPATTQASQAAYNSKCCLDGPHCLPQDVISTQCSGHVGIMRLDAQRGPAMAAAGSTKLPIACDVPLDQSGPVSTLLSAINAPQRRELREAASTPPEQGRLSSRAHQQTSRAPTKVASSGRAALRPLSWPWRRRRRRRLACRLLPASPVTSAARHAVAAA